MCGPISWHGTLALKTDRKQHVSSPQQEIVCGYARVIDMDAASSEALPVTDSYATLAPGAVVKADGSHEHEILLVQPARPLPQMT